MVDINKIPKELLEKRDVIECNFIFSLYKDINLVDNYKNIINGEDIITEDGKFYYGLVQGMKRSGYNSVNNIDIFTYLEDKKVLKDGFEKRGGWKEVQDIINILSIDNLPVYADELAKNNMLIRLHQKNFPVIADLDKFKDMTTEEVYAYYNCILADISIDKIEKLKAEDLTQNYEEWIELWDKGLDVGYKISSRMLNYQLLGVHKKNLLLHLAGIGEGKTTSAIHWYILPTIEHQDVTIIANEQDVSAWRQMILSTVMFNKLGYDSGVPGLDRHKMLTGGFTEEQKERMKEASIWLESQPGKINFIETDDYSVVNIKKIMNKYAALGCGLFIVDTLKPMDDASDKSWGEFSEVAKELFLLSKKLDVATVATCQLSPEAMSRRYLDLTCIAKAKAIAETASTVVMFRRLTKEEREKIKPYNYDVNNRKIKKTIDLDINKEYIMVFTPKNRYGQTQPQIIMERNMGFNSYKDVGWYECTYDQFRTR